MNTRSYRTRLNPSDLVMFYRKSIGLVLRVTKRLRSQRLVTDVTVLGEDGTIETVDLRFIGRLI